MASSSKPRIYTFLAAAAQAAYTFAKPGADNKHVALATAASNKLIGIQQNVTSAAEDPAEVAMNGGGAKLKLGGTVSFGDKLTSDGSGFGIATTSNADQYGAVAMSDGVSGDVIPVEVVLGIV